VALQILAQIVAEAGRAAEPQVAVLPVRRQLAQALGGQPAVLAGHQHVQAHAGALGQLFDALDEATVRRAGAVEQIGVAALAAVRQDLQPADEGGDADAAGHPDLPGLVAVEIEAAVGPLDRDQIAHLQGVRQGTGVVAEPLDGECQPAVIAPGRREAERVRALPGVEGDEGELPGLVARPGAVELDFDPQDAVILMVGQCLYAADHLVLAADATQQRDARGHRAGGQHQRQHHAQRRAPVHRRRQHHRVQHQQQIDQRQPAVRLEEPAVGKALDQRQHDQDRTGVEGPLAEILSRPMEVAQEAGDTSGRLFGAATCRPLQPAEADQPFRYLPPAPVDGGDHQGADAQPLVQPVGLVQAVEEAFEPFRPGGQYHRDAHRTDGQHTAVIDQRLAQGPERVARHDEVIDQQP